VGAALREKQRPFLVLPSLSRGIASLFPAQTIASATHVWEGWVQQVVCAHPCFRLGVEVVKSNVTGRRQDLRQHGSFG